MFGEALEDLESCGQSELLRELEVGPPTPQTFLGNPRAWTLPMRVPLETSMLMGSCPGMVCTTQSLGALRVQVSSHTCRLCMDTYRGVMESTGMAHGGVCTCRHVCSRGMRVCVHVSMLVYAQMRRVFSQQICVSARLDAEGRFWSLCAGTAWGCGGRRAL